MVVRKGILSFPKENLKVLNTLKSSISYSALLQSLSISAVLDLSQDFRKRVVTDDNTQCCSITHENLIRGMFIMHF